MSLFRAREWWTATTGSEEEFAPTAFCVADVDNQGGGAPARRRLPPPARAARPRAARARPPPARRAPRADKMVTGSLSGVLRIYLPRQRGYRAEDLLLEQRLDAPIVQLAAGALLASSSRLALAVLHPRKLAVYEVHAGTQSGAPHALARAFEVGLQRTSFNMALGRFGGSAHESAAVQSIDGSVSVLHGHELAYTRLLADALVPGPWVYSPRLECFYTANSLLQVCCYKLSALAQAQAEAPPTQPAPGGGGGGGQGERRVAADWSVMVGEHVVDVQLGRFSRGLGSGQAELVVLCWQSLLTLPEGGGAPTYARRLEMAPACMALFPAGEGADPATGGAHNLLLCSATGALQLLRGGELLWAARAERPPIALAVCQLAQIRGEQTHASPTCTRPRPAPRHPLTARAPSSLRASARAQA